MVVEVTMNVGLWIIQVALAALFLYSGVFKGFRSKAAVVAAGQTGVTHYSAGFIKLIATCELAGCLGLIAPQLTGIARWLTPLAAGCLGLVMIGAAASHARLAREDPMRETRELTNVTTNLAILAACLVVVVGRGC
jgi:uncharacterized membrane protein YphA (DoxX/SURF4 family)